jgi:hypothetical protein
VFPPPGASNISNAVYFPRVSADVRRKVTSSPIIGLVIVSHLFHAGCAISVSITLFFKQNNMHLQQKVAYLHKLNIAFISGVFIDIYGCILK